MEERITPLQVRFIYGFTTVAVIFALGMLVGGLMWIIARFAARAQKA